LPSIRTGAGPFHYDQVRTCNAHTATCAFLRRSSSLGWGLQGKVVRTPHQSKGRDDTVLVILYHRGTNKENAAILILKRHTSHNTSCGFFLRAPASRLLRKRPRLPRSQGAAPQRSRTAAAGTPGLPSGDLGEPPDPLDTPRLAAHTAGSHTIQGDTPR
jgi:hypothetical protein